MSQCLKLSFILKPYGEFQKMKVSVSHQAMFWESLLAGFLGNKES